VKLKAVIHEAEEGGFWAEIPELPGCCAQGDSRAELLANLKEAAEGCLACGLGDPEPDALDKAPPTGAVDHTVEITE
jgi:predicted RNase H-like HicB family nuclease